MAECKKRPTAVYLTSPDYLGRQEDVSLLAQICHRYGVILAVDCAHGAYLRFLDESLYPTDLGADICCSSAHKTLPVITGGAYLSISESAPSVFAENAKDALALFGSTSPSYLILQSLDMANFYLATEYRENLKCFVQKTENLKIKLRNKGFEFRKLSRGTSPLYRENGPALVLGNVGMIACLIVMGLLLAINLIPVR